MDKVTWWLYLGLMNVLSGLRIIEAALTLTPSSQNIAENSPLALTCSYSGSKTVETYTMSVSSASTAAGSLLANCDVFITSPNSMLYEYSCPSSKTLVWNIKNVTRANEGDTWTCLIGFTTSGSENAELTINVQVPIQSVKLTSPTENVITVLENTELLIVCTTSGGLPAATVRWYKDKHTTTTANDVEITTSVIYTTRKTNDDLISVTSTLKYSPNKSENGVKIYCTAINSAYTLSSRKIQLNVQYSPDGPPIIEDNKYGNSYNIIEHSQGSLSCSIKGGNPLATLTWNCFNTGSASVIVGTTVTKTVTWTTVRDVDRSCTCQSSHIVTGTQSVSINVQVLYPPDSPKFKVSSKSVSGPVSFIEGKTRSIGCESNGKPNPDTYTWKTSDTIVRTDNTLTFSGVQKQDDGQYMCSAQNTMIQSDGTRQTGTNSSAITLTVLFSPTAPSLYYGGINGQSITRSSINVVRGDTFTVACKSEGQPEPNYRWSGQTSDNQILSITSINDNQSRTCTSSNTMRETNGETQQGSATTELTLNVLYPPSITECKLTYSTGFPVPVTNSVDVIEGSSFTLTCAADSKPAATFTWSGPEMSSSATLAINNTRKQQNGTYVVTAENIMNKTFGGSKSGRDTKTFDINILYAPKVQELNTKDILAGSQMSISCPVVKGNPSAVIFKWTRYGDSRVWDNQILLIDNITKHDDMIYTCAVQNIMKPTAASQQNGKDSGSFHLNVLYKASVTSFIVHGSEGPVSVTVNENDNVPFVCIVDSNPKSSIEIQFQRETLHRQDNTMSLMYNNSKAACQDTGVYTCTASNMYNYGKESLRKLTVFVRCSPRPLGHIKENITSVLRVSATLSFTGLAFPVPETTGFTWQKKEGTKWRTLSNSSDIFITISDVSSNLTVNSVSQVDYGKYQLIIQNEVKAYTQTFQLEPEGVPESPTDFKALDDYILKASVLLQWKPGFNGGPEQTFILMYKSTAEQIWKNVTVEDTGEITMNYTLVQLHSGTKYQAVIFARNRVGDSSISITETFSTAEEIEEEHKSSSAMIGGVVGGTLLCAVIVVIVVILYRRNVITCEGVLKNTSNKRTAGSSEHQDYVDLQHASHDNATNVYDSLQQDPDTTPSGSSQSVYMHLGTQAKNEDKHVYTNLQQHQDTDDEKKVYVNLNIKRF